jgi:glutamine synthetase
MKEDATANGVPEKDVKRFLEEGDIELVRLEIPDIDGLLRGKWVSTPKFIQSMRKGIGISNIILGYDISDVPYAPLSPNDDSELLPTWKLGPYADIYMVPNLGTLRKLP